MLQRTTKLLIGKDINRDAQVVAGALITTTVGNTGLADGEIVVLDKNFKVLAEGATIADSDIIYVCQGTGSTYTYATEAAPATAITGRHILLSDPIYGAFVKNYNAEPYIAPAQQVTTFDLTGLTAVLGTEYILNIIYKDINAHPSQFTQTYRFIGTDADIDTVGAGLVARIVAHKGSRVTAAYEAGGDVITLTGKAIPSSTTSLNDIDEHTMVTFEAYLNYVDTDGNWAEWGAVKATTEANYGSGAWYQVRDLEKKYLGYTGPMNRTLFPVNSPDFRTVINSTYNIITIEHERPYTSPDNQYVKYAPMTTLIAITVPSAGTQTANVLAQLNPWMASTPRALGAIAF